MSTLRIREYSAVGNADVGRDTDGLVIGRQPSPVAMEPGTDQTALTYSTSAASAAFGATTRYVAIESDTDFHYVVGAAPTATTNALKVPAGTIMFFGVTPGHKVAAIDAA